MTELRAALVFPGCHPRGGVERVVWETMRHLSGRHRVTVVASVVDTAATTGVDVRRVPAVGRPLAFAPVRWRRAAARCLRGVERDVVVSYGVDCPVGDVLVVQSVHRAWLELGRSVPYHGVHVPAGARYVLPRHQVLLALEAAYFRAGRGRPVVAVSENVAADLARFYDVPDDQVVVIPNGYSGEQCSPQRAAARRREMRAALALAEEDVAFLLIANEWHRKGLRVLLDATASLQDRRAHVVLVGRAPPGAYEAQARRLGLAERLHYCGPTDDVARFHAAADVFVMPTQYEAFGSVIVEALASGVPVITTTRAGAAVAVEPGANGLLQDDPDDAAELAALLARALDAGERARWSQAAPGSVRGYEWSSVMARMERVIAGARR